MPINIPAELPALEELLSENIFAMNDARATSQNIRPMQIGILNLMPNKIETELQILRLLSNTPLQINIDLIRFDETAPKNTPASHMQAFYHLFSQVKNKKYDGLIVTGAPLGTLDYEDVHYWPQMCELMDWAKHNVQSTFYICWAAHAAMYHYFGAQKSLLDGKLSGVFNHKVQDEQNELMRGFDPEFWAPHSRVAQVNRSTYASISGLEILAESEQAGVYAAATTDKRLVFVTGHPEYDTATLEQEFARDTQSGLLPQVPSNYFKNDVPEHGIMVRWKSHGNLLFTNWLNYYVYQTTPYDLTQLT
ncbi:homoserine O-succinyltransferase [Glaciecola punicea ACAM 611]|jgi:homoserine O-succinyltransferase|uniref:Homoserine O-succinyltransferase n=1 Tax=Glaciecola punicea ACAM 611 TaxID=1121923 RepID=H5TB90_9ALTE|nr:homoserine O-succinyltransferase [Glaciecola punicea]OFA30031.1 homoserine O-succinyltransferase [Glaciecola punicea]GAB55567.1 homoserine O-succinyltransferase [Glaciecola punicea ACAM 611]